MKKRAISFILIFSVVLSVFLSFNIKTAYSMTKEEILNSAVLTPMKTGYTPTDETIEKLFGEIFTEGMTTYDKVKACYDAVIYNTEYGKSFNSLEVPIVQREYGFIAYRDAYIALRANTFITGRVGVCNDYSCAFVALTRAIGLKSYIVTGKTNTVSGGYTGHMWVNVLIDGVYYTFDPQVECNIMLRREDKQITYSRFCVTDEDMAGRLILDNREYDISLFNDFKKEGQTDVTHPTILPTDTIVSTSQTTATQASASQTTTPQTAAPSSSVLGSISASVEGKIQLGQEITFTVSDMPSDAVLITVLSGIGENIDKDSVKYPVAKYTEDGKIIWKPDRLGAYTVVCYADDGNGGSVLAASFEYEFIPEHSIITEENYITGFHAKTPVSNITADDHENKCGFTDASGAELTQDSFLSTGCIYISDGVKYKIYIKGDTDGDGKISATDYILIKKCLLGTSLLEKEYYKAADTDTDGMLSQTDYIIIKRHILGISDMYAQ